MPTSSQITPTITFTTITSSKDVSDRSLPRSVTFYDATKPGETLGGFVQNGSITEANFLDILGILLVIEEGPIGVQYSVLNGAVRPS